MSDASTLFLSQPPIRPSWTLNGVTWELNLVPPAGGAGGSGNLNNGYTTAGFQGIPQGALFTSVVGGAITQNAPPVRLALRNNQTWTAPQITDNPTVGMSFADSLFAVTQSAAAFVSTGPNLIAASNQSNTTATVSLVHTGDVLEQGICQIQQLVAKGFLTNQSLNTATPAAASAAATTLYAVGTQVNDQRTVKKDSPRKRRKSKGANMIPSTSSAIEQALVPPAISVCQLPSIHEQQAQARQTPVTPAEHSENGVFIAEDKSLGVEVERDNVIISSGISPNTTVLSPSDRLPRPVPIRPLISNRDHQSPAGIQVAEVTTSGVNRGSGSVTPTTQNSRIREENVSQPSSPITMTPATTIPALIPISTQNISSQSLPGINTSASNIPVGIAVGRQRSTKPKETVTMSVHKENQQTNFVAISAESITQHTTIPMSVTTASSAVATVIACDGDTATKPVVSSSVAGMFSPATATSWPQHLHGHHLHHNNPFNAASNSIPPPPPPPAPPVAHASNGVTPDGGNVGISNSNSSNNNNNIWRQYPGITTEQSVPVGFQLVKDPTTGQFILIPSGQLDPVHRAIIVPTNSTSNCSNAATGQSFLVTGPAHHTTSTPLLLDNHLVTVLPSNIVTNTPAAVAATVDYAKQKHQIPGGASTIFKFDDPAAFTGLMMPYDMSKPSNGAPLGQQFMATNNSTISLVQQLSMLGNANQIQNHNIQMPQHFSTISSAGSLLIQQISGNNAAPAPLINAHPQQVTHVNNSVLISAESAAAAQSIFNTQHFPINNNSLVINTQQISAGNSSIIGQLHPEPPTLIHQILPQINNNSGNNGPSALSIQPASYTSIDFTRSQVKHITSPERLSPEKLLVEKNVRCDESDEEEEEKEDADDIEVSTLMQGKENTHAASEALRQLIQDAVNETPTNVQDAGNQTDSPPCIKTKIVEDRRDVTPQNSVKCITPQNTVKCITPQSPSTAPTSEGFSDYVSDAKYIIGRYDTDSDTDSDAEGRMVVDESYNAGVHKSPEPPATTSGPDFSGLQLLLNGIEQVEHRKSASVTPEVPEKRETEFYIRDGGSSAQNVLLPEDDSLTTPQKEHVKALDILCTYAEQKIHEEEELSKVNTSSPSSAPSGAPVLGMLSLKKKCLKRKIPKSENKMKTSDSFKTHYRTEGFRTYSKTGGEDELKKKIELAKLQKQNREIQKLGCSSSNITINSGSTIPNTSAAWLPSSNLLVSPSASVRSTSGFGIPESDTSTKRGPGRPRKQPSGAPTPIPKKLKLGSPDTHKKYKKNLSLKIEKAPVRRDSPVQELSPPILEPMCLPPEKYLPPVLLPNGIYARKTVSEGYSGNSPGTKQPLMSKYGHSPLVESSMRPYGDYDDSDEDKDSARSCSSPPPSSSPLCRSPARKRKVGRPRKYPHDKFNSTETIVAKKPKTSLSEIMLLSRQQKSATKSDTIPKRLGASSPRNIPVTSNVISTLALMKSQKNLKTTDNECTDYNPRKIMPKLKAEIKFKNGRREPRTPDKNYGLLLKKKKKSLDFEKLSFSPAEVSDDEILESKHSGKVNSDPEPELSFHSRDKPCRDYSRVKKPLGPYSETSLEVCYSNNYRLTQRLLDMIVNRTLRILVPVSGLYKAGELSAIRPPDLYCVKLDGDDSRDARIYDKKEVLKDIVLEVKGKLPLKKGTRVCAYWSPHFLSLYPGRVIDLSPFDEWNNHDDTLTSIRFDDGDKGCISIDDIRLLPKDKTAVCDDKRGNEDKNNGEDDTERLALKGHVSPVRDYKGIYVEKQRHSSLVSSLSWDSKPILQKDDTWGTELSPVKSRTAVVSSSYSTQEHAQNTSCKDGSGDSSTISPSRSSGSSPGLLSPFSPNKQVDSADTNSKDLFTHEMSVKKRSKKKHKDKKEKSSKHRSHKHRSEDEKHHKRRKHKHKHRKHKHHHSTDSDIVLDYNYNVQTHKSENVDDSRQKQSSESDKEFLEIERPVMPSLTESLEELEKYKESPKIGFSSSNSDSTNSEKCEQPQIQHTMKVDYEQSENCGLDLTLELEVEPDYETEQQASIQEQKDQPVPKMELSEDTNRSEIESSDTRKLSMNVESTEKKMNMSKPSREEKKKSKNKKPPVVTRLLWNWEGKGVIRRCGKGRMKREYFRAIKKEDEIIRVGDCAVFLTEGNPSRPFIGHIESLWECTGIKTVKVTWFYHPEETSGLTEKLPYAGGLFESPHSDTNDVQTIAHKCEVLPLKEYKERIEENPELLQKVYEHNDLYYLAGRYDPTNKRLTFEKDIL